MSRRNTTCRLPVRVACLGLFLLLLGGCGQKGPLYLPDERGEDKSQDDGKPDG